jgi:hypothetical protein
VLPCYLVSPPVSIAGSGEVRVLCVPLRLFLLQVVRMASNACALIGTRQNPVTRVRKGHSPLSYSEEEPQRRANCAHLCATRSSLIAHIAQDAMYAPPADVCATRDNGGTTNTTLAGVSASDHSGPLEDPGRGVMCRISSLSTPGSLSNRRKNQLPTAPTTRLIRKYAISATNKNP